MDAIPLKAGVMNFIPATMFSGRKQESFVVCGKRFACSNGVVTSGFRQTAAEGAPIREGLYVRLSHQIIIAWPPISAARRTGGIATKLSASSSREAGQSSRAPPTARTCHSAGRHDIVGEISIVSGALQRPGRANGTIAACAKSAKKTSTRSTHLFKTGL
jgi:hypothetical protein